MDSLSHKVSLAHLKVSVKIFCRSRDLFPGAVREVISALAQYERSEVATTATRRKITLYVYNDARDYENGGYDMAISTYENAGITYAVVSGACEVHVADPRNIRLEVVRALLVDQRPALRDGLAEYIAGGPASKASLMESAALATKPDGRLLTEYYRGAGLLRKMPEEPPAEEFAAWLAQFKLDDALRVAPGRPMLNGFSTAVLHDGNQAVGKFPAVGFYYHNGALHVYCQAGRALRVDEDYKYVWVRARADGTHYGELCDEDSVPFVGSDDFLRQKKRWSTGKLPASKRLEFLSRFSDTDKEKLEEDEMGQLRRCDDYDAPPFVGPVNLQRLDAQSVKAAFDRGVPLTLRPTADRDGAMYSPASIYLEEKKLGELSSATGAFSADGSFLYTDYMRNVDVEYRRPCYVSKGADGRLRFVSAVTYADPPIFTLGLVADCVCEAAAMERLLPCLEPPPNEAQMRVPRYFVEPSEETIAGVRRGVVKSGGRTVTVLRYVGLGVGADGVIRVVDFCAGGETPLPGNKLKLARSDGKKTVLYTPRGEEEDKNLLYLTPGADVPFLIDPLVAVTYGVDRVGLMNVGAYEIGTEFDCRAEEGEVRLYAEDAFVGTMVLTQSFCLENVRWAEKYVNHLYDYTPGAVMDPNAFGEEEREEEWVTFRLGARGPLVHEMIVV